MIYKCCMIFKDEMVNEKEMWKKTKMKKDVMR